VAAGLSQRVHFRTIGLSKAVASRGGVIVCSQRNAEYFRYESLPAIFSTSVMQHEVAGFDAVLDILEKEEWRRTTLHANHAYLKAGLDKLGYNVEASKSQIIALEAGDIRQTTTLRDALESRGVFGAIFFPPATPEKRCIIRFTLNCGLTRRELDYIIEVCDDIRAEVGMAEWRSTKRKALDQAKAAAPHRAEPVPVPVPVAAVAGEGAPVAAPPSLPASSALDGGRLHDWQVYREGGANVGRGPARDRTAAALDNHPAE
jgi:CAI-1 autoinducer synthase